MSHWRACDPLTGVSCCETFRGALTQTCALKDTRETLSLARRCFVKVTVTPFVLLDGF